MTSPSTPLHATRPRRRTVRLIFLAVGIYFLFGMAFRKKYGEFYPSLLMPSFAGTGLTSMTDKIGETNLPGIVVAFSDKSTAALTPTQFAGPFFPSAVIVKYFAQDPAGNFLPVTAEAKAYAASRIAQLFPGRTPIEVKLTINRITFPLDHPGDDTIAGQIAVQHIVFP